LSFYYWDPAQDDGWAKEPASERALGVEQGEEPVLAHVLGAERALVQEPGGELEQALAEALDEEQV
jgi:hypothetical protein